MFFKATSSHGCILCVRLVVCIALQVIVSVCFPVCFLFCVSLSAFFRICSVAVSPQKQPGASKKTKLLFFEARTTVLFEGSFFEARASITLGFRSEMDSQLHVNCASQKSKCFKRPAMKLLDFKFNVSSTLCKMICVEALGF